MMSLGLSSSSSAGAAMRAQGIAAAKAVAVLHAAGVEAEMLWDDARGEFVVAVVSVPESVSVGGSTLVDGWTPVVAAA